MGYIPAPAPPKRLVFDHEHSLAEQVTLYTGGSLITCDLCDWTAALPVETDTNHTREWELWHDGKPRASGWCITCGDGSVNRHSPNLFALPKGLS